MIDNARLYEAARVAAASGCRPPPRSPAGMLRPPPTTPAIRCELIADRSREVADADLVTVAAPRRRARARTCGSQVAVGAGADGIMDFAVPLSAIAVRAGVHDRQAAAADVTRTSAGLACGPPCRRSWTPVRCWSCRCAAPTACTACSTVVRLRGRAAFTAEDLDMATGFANQASVALELARRPRRPATRRPARRARTHRRGPARPRHPTPVRHRPVAAGTRRHPRPRRGATDRVTGHRRRPRRHHQPDPHRHLPAPAAPRRPTRERGLRGPRARRGRRGHPRPRVRPRRPVLRRCSTPFPTDVGDDLLAVLREALTNIARHAHAHTADVDAHRRTTTGSPSTSATTASASATPTRRSGLANLRHRAEHHGGTLTLTPHHPHGTELCWTVPT